MKPRGSNPNETGLLEYLEDIIGSNKFVEEIEELERVLEDCNERRIEQTNRVKASQHELQGLSDARRIAVSWIKQERKSFKLQTYRFFIDLGDGVRQCNELTKQITDLTTEARRNREERRAKFK